MWINLRPLQQVGHYPHTPPHRLTTCCLEPNFASYIPHALASALEYIRSFTSNILARNPPSTDAADVSQQRQLLSDAETSLREAEANLKSVQQDLDDLFKPDRFGKDGEWKKLDKLCLEKDTGGYVLPTARDMTSSCSPLPRYTYEVCLFGEARQKANSGGSVQSLGHFSSWKEDEEVGTPDYYSRQVFTNGAKCWNGPQRSVQVCSLNLSTSRFINVPGRLTCRADLTTSF